MKMKMRKNCTVLQLWYLKTVFFVWSVMWIIYEYWMDGVVLYANVLFCFKKRNISYSVVHALNYNVCVALHVLPLSLYDNNTARS